MPSHWQKCQVRFAVSPAVCVPNVVWRDREKRNGSTQRCWPVWRHSGLMEATVKI